MSIMSDNCIKKLCSSSLEKKMISPFVDKQVKEGKIISYGLSSYGYDARLGEDFTIITRSRSDIYIDPKEVSDDVFINEHNKNFCVIPPNGFALGVTHESFIIPDDVLGICVGKSTYARCGIIVNTTPLEPGWSGKLTLEFSNTTPLPAKIYVKEGICQLLFFKGDIPCVKSYAARNGKYMNQKTVTLPRVEA